MARSQADTPGVDPCTGDGHLLAQDRVVRRLHQQRVPRQGQRAVPARGVAYGRAEGTAERGRARGHDRDRQVLEVLPFPVGEPFDDPREQRLPSGEVVGGRADAESRFDIHGPVGESPDPPFAQHPDRCVQQDLAPTRHALRLHLQSTSRQVSYLIQLGWSPTIAGIARGWSGFVLRRRGRSRTRQSSTMAGSSRPAEPVGSPRDRGGATPGSARTGLRRHTHIHTAKSGDAQGGRVSPAVAIPSLNDSSH